MQIKPAAHAALLTAFLATVLALGPLTLPASSQASAADTSLSDYLPEDVDYDPEIPTPSSVLGFKVGTWHVRHDLLVAYMRTLAESSDRIRLEVAGKTHEERPLLLLIVSSPENLQNLETLRQEHLKLSDPQVERPDTSGMPVFVHLGYSIHGNEASGSNAALLVAYHLAAARGAGVDELLENTVILLDPSFNPDGLGRFATWANMHRGQVLVADSEHREHREGWPNGRTNHYWFDLNRDWLPLVHPESRARIVNFHRFKPNVLTDHHEMGTDQTFFFQPGVPSRRNPLTPERNVELTGEIARFHAEALDAIGSLYFTEEVFDDFYYGKGSTYPDVNGTIGILFEQGSARGHLQESINGPVSFPFAIKNQFTTSLSTLRAALAKRQELLDYQADFYRDAYAEADDLDTAAWVFGDPDDPRRNQLFLELLRRHHVEVHELAETVEADGRRFAAGEGFVVPVKQAQSRLVRALFERVLDFEDKTFYDVSTWTMPLAYGLPSVPVGRGGFSTSLLGEAIDVPEVPRGRILPAGEEEPTVAWLFSWDGFFAPRALYRLLDAGLVVRVATRPFSAHTAEGVREYAEGTIVVPLGLQTTSPEEIRKLIATIAFEDGVDVDAATSGLTPVGIDLGSPSMSPLELPKAALVVGDGVSAYAAGEIWQLLDERFHIPLSLLEMSHLGRVDLGEYTHLVLTDGSYGDLSEKLVEEIGDFVRGGGVLIAVRRAAKWADDLLGTSLPPEPTEGGKPAADEKKPERHPYADFRGDRAAELVSGAIFEVELDLTHPIAFGYDEEALPVFRNSTIVLEPQKNPYSTVAVYADKAQLSGYVSDENVEKIKSTPAVVATRLGEGTVVRIIDPPNFRGFWLGTNKLFLNSLFFGPIVERTFDARERP